MSKRLKNVANWTELAPKANWSVKNLAKLCGISERTLEQYFLKNMGKSPKEWLVEQRCSWAITFLRDGSSVKETAAHLGYKYANHFSREFKRHYGFTPRQINLFSYKDSVATT
jgi:AraC-like DNA-binding protein